MKFSAEEQVVLNTLSLLDNDQFLSLQELNIILGIEDKTYDNQRKLRHNTISKLNDKLEAKFNLKVSIQKIAGIDDKRVSNYSLNQKIKSKIPANRYK